SHETLRRFLRGGWTQLCREPWRNLRPARTERGRQVHAAAHADDARAPHVGHCPREWSRCRARAQRGPQSHRRHSAGHDVRSQITKRFGDFCAVDGLSFAVNHGEIFGLLGPNGAGKSTLLRMLTTLVPPTSGIALVNGHDVVREPNEVRKAIGVIPQAMTSDL